MDKHVSVIIVPHDNARTLNLKFSYRLLYLLGGLVAVVVISVLVLVVTYGRVLYTAQQSARLARENRKLQHQAAQIDSLKLELINLHAFSIQIKGMLGVELSKDSHRRRLCRR